MRSLVYLLFNKLNCSTYANTGSKILSMTMMSSALELGWLGNGWPEHGLGRKQVRSKKVRRVAGEQESYTGKESGSPWPPRP